MVLKKYIIDPIKILVKDVSAYRPVSLSIEAHNNDTAAVDSFRGNELDLLEFAIHEMETYIDTAFLEHVELEKMTGRIRHLETEVDKIYYDPLTGLYNRRYLDENLEHIMSSLSRSGGALSVLMVDIDHFKIYNDFYGHLQGDECLKIIAAAIQKSAVRADDFAVRYGGEEFAVILPNTKKSGALYIAHILIEKICELQVPHEESPVARHVTVSVGVTTGRVRHTHKAAHYLKRADDMLYKSKQNGRNMFTYGNLE